MGIYEKLAVAFGGYSQVRNADVGAAVVGHCNNGTHMHQDAKARRQLLAATIDEVLGYWDDVGDPNSEEIRRRVYEGARSACASLGETGRVIAGQLGL